ncbi:MAG TPA: LysR substrate-binding domain-containing protein [Stellaceae bacterium]|jgi:LysR family glycine cleavage system transcriptional activator
MASRYPPFRCIEAFVAAAQALSFTEAASSLRITVPAVSRRIQTLETDLGVRLFRRGHRAVTLTPAGESYLKKLLPALGTIREASDSLRATPRRRSLKVSLPASLAAHWLVPRLGAFQARHPGIQVELETVVDDVALDRAEVDVAIQLGTGHWPGFHADLLFEVDAYPVCSPALADEMLRTPHDLEHCTLLGSSQIPELWPTWLRAAGQQPLGRYRYVAYDNLQLLYEAAATGLGVAIAVDVMARPLLASGRLAEPFSLRTKLSRSYYVICRATDTARLPIHNFRMWLLEEAAMWNSGPKMSLQSSAPSSPSAETVRSPVVVG